MKVTGNPLLTGASGKIGNLVVKQYQDKTVITTVPDMSRRKLSPKQKENNELMSMAIIVAKSYKADPRLKQRACEILQVPPNKVFRAIVKHFLLSKGEGNLFEETEQEKLDKKTATALKKIIRTEIPDAEAYLFGDRAKGVHTTQSDWDLLLLTTRNYSSAIKWKLQENLLNYTLQQGTRATILLVPHTKWETAPEYELLRKRVQDELVTLGS
ncbi:nucleotidyltransferase domain-containing protein [Flavihumibacter sp. UBA7668]|uniref:nucleotidyltransferase domain-containing protein n=1 Tax=Flavihumibacter sp. UBA7668 TaxID=1946542 RepID=UPI0025BF0F5B|nr:nucleotidyltransferase domain-containing protein [Flavihumibacter sp. UBA7668]